MFPPHPTDLLHFMLKDEISEGDLAIDATAGNGNDTVFLANAVGTSGKVIAIDIQENAIIATRVRLSEEGLLDRVSLHHGSHTDLPKLADHGTAKAIIFNLGYLPGADRNITTRTPDTLNALQSATGLLKPGGILAAVCYPGHDAGKEESEAVEAFFLSLPHHRTAKYSLVATRNPAPFLLIARNGRKTSDFQR